MQSASETDILVIFQSFKPLPISSSVRTTFLESGVFVALLSKALFLKWKFEEGNLFWKNTGSISYKDIGGNGGFSILIGCKTSVSPPVTKCRSFYFQLNNPLSPTHSIFWTIFDRSWVFVPRDFRPRISSQCTSKCSIVANDKCPTVQGCGKLRTKLWFGTDPRSWWLCLIRRMRILHSDWFLFWNVDWV